jgi:hypothetical protein
LRSTRGDGSTGHVRSQRQWSIILCSVESGVTVDLRRGPRRSYPLRSLTGSLREQLTRRGSERSKGAAANGSEGVARICHLGIDILRSPFKPHHLPQGSAKRIRKRTSELWSHSMREPCLGHCATVPAQGLTRAVVCDRCRAVHTLAKPNPSSLSVRIC